MRILQIRFKNLNSLVGEWDIDLTHPAFDSDGIFAITGPTGSGKTTILDAICLALYGRTPRLNKVTKSGNEIMSRQTGECFAEVTFETQAGRYRSHWSQHRARKKSDGELQAPKHEISNADSGEIFESKIRGVADQIESATGMDFDRFTRSMLLAQGGFAAFLQAAPDERAPILEQITGTAIYSQISIRVHEQQREEREKLNIFQAETTGIVILEPEQEKDTQQLLEIKYQEETDLAAKMVSTAKAITWLTTIAGLDQDILNLADEANILHSDIDAFKPERNKLNQALNAASLDGLYAMFITIRQQQMDDRESLRALEERLPEQKLSAKEQFESLTLAEHQTAKAKEELSTTAPLILKVRSLDQKLVDQHRTILEGNQSYQKDVKKITADKQLKLKEQERRSDTEKMLELVDGYLKGHTEDEWLISGLAGIEEQLIALLAKQTDIIQTEVDQEKALTALEKSTKLLTDSQVKCSVLQQKLDQTATILQQGKATLSLLLGDRLLREYRTDKESLLREMMFLSKIAELEDHRSKLEDKMPCPLCGAIEHPYAEGNIPVLDETEQKIEALAKLISDAEDQETIIKQLEEAEIAARNNLAAGEKQETAAANDNKAAEKTLIEVEAGLKKYRIDFSECREIVATKLLPLGIEDIPNAEILSLLESLKIRMKTWQTQIQKKTEIEKQLATLASDIKYLDAIIETQSIALADKQEGLENLNQAYIAVTGERKELYGDKSPDDEELRLNQAVVDAERAEKHARDLYNKLQQQWNTAKSHVESLKKRLDQREPELKSLDTEFFTARVATNFLTEEQFLEARLKGQQRNELTVKAKKLDDRQTELKARQTDRKSRLAMELAKNITDKPLHELEPKLKQCDITLNQLRDIIAGLKHRLSENSTAKEQIKEKQAIIAAQKKECIRWDNLHELIGSADGKKYRNFAQGLTFEMMIAHANQQLQKMTDRYLLSCDETQPLELNVVDNYQAGEIRSTKNLSGGESFIVSLSLALGLSQMASKNVRVDSLFLDEGFGTLDEEALDTALETLAGLQQDGKLIGVISHVLALKERISTQIQVVPQIGGKSQIFGPGCSRLNIVG